MNLDPVRAALLADADMEAADLIDAARAEQADTLGSARRDAEERIRTARAEGLAAADAAAAEQRARTRREAREIVLAARRAVWEQARERLRTAAGQRREQPGLTEALAGLAREQLGDDAAVSVDTDVGGVIATHGSRSVDYRLPAVADRLLDAHREEVGGLWE